MEEFEVLHAIGKYLGHFEGFGRCPKLPKYFKFLPSEANRTPSLNIHKSCCSIEMSEQNKNI